MRSVINKLISLYAPEWVERIVACGLILFFSTYVWLYQQSSEAFLNSGDGLSHFLIAKWAFKHPELFLDHWGKPLFNIVAAPFAQLGPQGIVLMNILASATTACFGYLTLKVLKNGLALAFIPVLYGSSIFFFETAAGMTEPLMAMIVSIMMWCWSTKRWGAFAVLASLLPYARPAGYLILVLTGGVLVLKSKWKKLPLLLTGTFFFGLVGWPVYGNPFWFFVNDPYIAAADFYGRGDDLFHFIRNWNYIYGEAALGVLGLGLLTILLDRSLRLSDRKNQLYLWAFIGAIGTLAVHSYLWWKGGLGSLGLIRVLASVSPLAAFSVFWLWDNFKVGVLSSSLFSIALTLTLVQLNHYPPVPTMKDRPTQEMILSSIKALDRQYDLEERHITSLHPIVSVIQDVDPWEKSDDGLYGFAGIARNPEDWLNPGDIVVWEGEITAGHTGVSLQELKDNPKLELIHLNSTRNFQQALDGTVIDLAAFMYNPTDKTVVDTVFSVSIDSLSSTDEFVNIELINLDVHTLSGAQMVCSGRVEAGEVIVVLGSQKSGEYYRGVHLTHEEVQHVVLRYDQEVFPVLLHLWNPGQQPFTIKDLNISIFALRPTVEG